MAVELVSAEPQPLHADDGNHWRCRAGCAACCIAPSISSAIPGHPHGKPAGVRCAQLTEDLRCAIFGLPQRPAVCTSLRPHPEMCGDSRDAALVYLAQLESATRSAGV